MEPHALDTLAMIVQAGAFRISQRNEGNMDHGRRMALRGARDRFAKAFMVFVYPMQEEEGYQQVGTLEGGDGRPVQVSRINASCDMVPKETGLYGCRPEEDALLVEWAPASEADASKRIAFPQETWAAFPKTYEGYPVYYRDSMRTVAEAAAGTA